MRIFRHSTLSVAYLTSLFLLHFNIRINSWTILALHFFDGFFLEAFLVWVGWLYIVYMRSAPVFVKFYQNWKIPSGLEILQGLRKNWGALQVADRTWYELRFADNLKNVRSPSNGVWVGGPFWFFPSFHQLQRSLPFFDRFVSVFCVQCL